MLGILTLGTVSMLVAVVPASLPTPGAHPTKSATVAPGSGSGANPDCQERVYLQCRSRMQPHGRAVGFSGDSDRAYNEF